MDIEDVWAQLIQQLKSYPSVNASQIDAFFSRIQIQAVSSDFIMFTANNSFIKDWVEKHYVKDIKRALLDLYGTDFFVQIEVDTTAQPQNIESLNQTSSQLEKTASPVNQEILSTRQQVVINTEELASKIEATPITEQLEKPNKEKGSYLKEPPSSKNQNGNSIVNNKSKNTLSGASDLTFDTFVIGDSNRMAYSMAVEVADKPGSSLNPLFIYGRSGVGKTHLLCAIQNYINEQYSDFNVCYIDSMELVNRYSDAAIEKSVDKQSFKNFEKFFEDADVLLIDDIQGLQDKPGTLGALFRIFNNLITKGKQFVFSADRAPKNIDLDERYVSRFNSGATIDIQPPDNETKRNIIKNFIHQYEEEENFKLDLSEDILSYIVDHSSSNVRELKSAITNVIFAVKMNKDQELTRQTVKELLANHFISEKESRLTIEMIQNAAADFFGITYNDIVSNKRSRNIAHPRQVAIYLCRELLESTFKAIGEEFNRDHSTIMHSYDLISNALKEDRNLREEIEAIREKLRIQQY